MSLYTCKENVEAVLGKGCREGSKIASTAFRHIKFIQLKQNQNKYLKPTTRKQVALKSIKTASFGFWKFENGSPNSGIFLEIDNKYSLNLRKCLSPKRQFFCHICKSFSFGDNDDRQIRLWLKKICACWKFKLLNFYK